MKLSRSLDMFRLSLSRMRLSSSKVTPGSSGESVVPTFAESVVSLSTRGSSLWT